MNKVSRKIAVGLLSIFTVHNAYAQDWVADYWSYGYLASIADSAGKIFADIDAWYKSTLNDAGQMIQDFTDAFTVNTSPTSSANSGLTYQTAAAAAGQALTQSSLVTLMSTPNPQTVLKPLATILSSDFPICNISNIIGSAMCGSQFNNAYAQISDNNFNLDVLLGATSITTSVPSNAPPGFPYNQSQMAQNFIQFVAGIVPPLPVLPIGLPTPDQNKLASYIEKPAVQNYLSSAHSYRALESVGLSNFNFLYGERLTQSGLGQQAKLKTIPNSATGSSSSIDDASILQIQEYMANRRALNPAWYSQIYNMTSTTALIKEVIFILAEIRYELFQNRLVAERQLAAASALQLQGLKAGRILLNQQYQSAKGVISGRSSTSY